MISEHTNGFHCAQSRGLSAARGIFSSSPKNTDNVIDKRLRFQAFERSIQRPVRGTSYWHNLVRGLIFFGVPTCGMDNAALIGVGASPSFPLLYNLGQSSPNLEKDFNTFVDLALASGKNIHVFCFAESQNTPTVQKVSRS